MKELCYNGNMYSVGVDEVGLGPILGPLSVASCSVEGDLKPCLALLRELGFARAESKQVYKGGKPMVKLARLEEAILPLYLASQNVGELRFALSELLCVDELREFESLAWYKGLGSMQLPVAGDAYIIRQKAAQLRKAFSGAVPIVLACKLCSVPAFNRRVAELDNKSLVLRGEILYLIETAIKEAGKKVQRLELTIDRLGGLKYYSAWLAAALAPEQIRIVEEGDERSAYELLSSEVSAWPVSIEFLVKGDEKNPLCALASLWAKYHRELIMLQFNQFWQSCAAQRGVQIPVSSGYYRDACAFLVSLQSLLGSDFEGLGYGSLRVEGQVQKKGSQTLQLWSPYLVRQR